MSRLHTLPSSLRATVGRGHRVSGSGHGLLRSGWGRQEYLTEIPVRKVRLAVAADAGMGSGRVHRRGKGSQERKGVTGGGVWGAAVSET